MEIVNMNGTLDRLVSKVIRFTNGLSRPDTSASEPTAEAFHVVVATVALVSPVHPIPDVQVRLDVLELIRKPFSGRARLLPSRCAGRRFKLGGSLALPVLG